jgi:PAS domain S-box-containing protein
VNDADKANRETGESRGPHGELATADSSSAELISILDTVDVPIVVVGCDCIVSRFNRAATETLGVISSDVGLHLSRVQGLSDVSGIDQECERVMQDGIPSRREIRRGERWFSVHIAPHTAGDGQTHGSVLTFTNVTAFRASIEQAIYEREYAKTIVNAVMAPVVVLDEALRVQTANRAFYDWFGISREKMQGMHLGDLGDWSTSELVAELLKATLADGRDIRTVEFEGHFLKAGRRTVLLDACRLPRNKNALVLLSFRDITERKQAEHALRESENRLRTLFESMNEGYCVIEMIFDTNETPIDYRFLEVNPVFEAQTGIKDARGRLMRDIAPAHEQHWFDLCGRVALTGETVRFENPAAAVNRHYDVCAFRVGPPELWRVGLIFSDITARKAMEQEREALLAQEEVLRRQAEAAARAKDLFLAALSHELRTPLSPVLLAAEMMDNYPDLPVTLRGTVAMIRRNIELEVRLIDDLLDLNRVTSGKMRLQMEPTRVHAALTLALQTCDWEISTKKLHVRADLQAQNDLVNADGARLQQVFWNVLRNAAKFTPQGGDIIVRSENVGGGVRVEVRDSGMGIAPELLPKVFDAFEQGNVNRSDQLGGLGLGLAICDNIVKMHGGVIRAQSEGPGKGATFTIELPTTADREAMVPPRDDDRRVDGRLRRLRVLLVEDNQDSREILAELLGELHYDVKTASSMAAALELAAAECFDIAVSDLGLPDGTGWDLMKQLRDRHAMKGIALSGYGTEADQQRSREAGFCDHVVKPVNAKRLLEVLERVAAGQIYS